MTYRNQHGERISNPWPSLAEMRDAKAELEAISREIGRLTARLALAAENHQCVWDLCREAALQIDSTCEAELETGIKRLFDKIWEGVE